MSFRRNVQVNETIWFIATQTVKNKKIQNI